MVQLPPFRVDELIGEGSAGQVYAGVHAPSDLPVAIKVVAGVAGDEAAALAFRREVQAAAALHHRHVVPVFDHGAVPAGTPGLPAGAPYLVMPLAHATLLPFVRHLEWPTIATVLFQILDALSHAHARGLVHCDLKPGNVLLFSDAEGATPALADFGIARAFGAVRSSREVVRGTPAYMAPEQFASPRDIGPATDLYALGCMAYEMLCRRQPFEARTPLAYGIAHTRAPRPMVEPAIEAPEPARRWIARLLSRDWRGRYRGAAEAALALGEFAQAGRAMLPAPTDRPVDLTWVDMASVRTLPMASPTTLSMPRDATDHADLRAELPPSWRRNDPPRAPSLSGAGAGLFGLRPVPFVGREAERDLIWEALRQVHAEEAPRVIVVRGAAGTGKSRLVEWMLQRADEVGAAAQLPMRHGPVFAAGHGIPGLLRRLIQPTGEDADLDRVCHLRGAARVDPRDGAVLALTGARGTAPYFQRDALRHAIVLEWLQAVAAPRTPAIWVDDAQWGVDALGLVTAALSASVPALVLLTVRPEDAAAEAIAALEAVIADPRTAVIDLRPLPVERHTELVEGMLPLDPSVVAHLVARTEGSPLFAVQLLSGWLTQGRLRREPAGLTLSADDMAALPDSVHDLWVTRLRHVTGGLDAAQMALEVAATLGAEVEVGEWMGALGAAGVELDGGFIDALLRRGLVRPTREGWAFAHGLLRESLLRLAAEAGRAERWHRICAEVLARQPAAVETLSREADHWLAAGLPARAVEPLTQAAAIAGERIMWTQRPALFARVASLLEALGVGLEDPRRVRFDLLRIMPLYVEQQTAAADALLARCEAAATRLGMDGARGSLLRIKGVMARHRGDLPGAGRMLAEAEGLCLAAGEIAQAGRAALGQVEVARRHGDFEEMAGCIERALAHFKMADDAFWIRTALHEQAQLLLARGRLDEAAVLLAELAREGLRAGDETTTARGHSYLGQVERLRGDLEAADAHFGRSQELYARSGNLNAHVMPGNRAHVALMQGRYAAAEALAAESEAGLARTQFPDVMPTTRLVRAAVAALTAGAEAAEPYMAEAERILQTPKVERGVAHFAEFVARLLESEGFTALAARAARIAIREWLTLGEGGRVAALQALAD